jgi:UDP-N-acetylglucosamine:LPS N-acetylglucosamine transferase
MPKRRINILILTSSGGQGLISGSEAIKEAFAEIADYDCRVRIVDFFEKGNRAGNLLTILYNYFLRRSLRLNSVYVRVINLLRLDHWRVLYRRSYRFLESLLTEAQPDVLIVTSQYIIAFVAWAMKRSKWRTPTYVANVDPGSFCAPLWFDKDIHLHLLPTRDSLEAYERFGFPKERARVTALLVRGRFLEAATTDRRKLRLELGLEPAAFTVLLAGSREGYMGVIPLVMGISGLDGIQVVVLCGTNSILKNSLQEYTKKSGRRIIVLGWCQDVHKLMRAADVVISKPGKQTMKESIAVNTPMITIGYPAIMDQERGNVEFMRKREIALVAGDEQEVSEYVRKLKNDRAYYHNLVSRLKDISRAEIDPRRVAQAILDDYVAVVRQPSSRSRARLVLEELNIAHRVLQIEDGHVTETIWR